MIEQSENLSIAMETRAVGFEVSPDKSHLESLLIQDSFGNERAVRAKLFVLASGTIENTRLVLSNPQLAVPGSGFKMVGKCLMDHPKGQCGYLYPYRKDFSFESHRIKNEKQEFIVDYALSSSHLAKKGLPNHCVMIEKERLSKIPRYKLIFHLEQMPYEASTISLSHQKDVFGSPVPSVDWQVSEEDKKLFQQFTEEIGKVFKELKLGEVHLSHEKSSIDALKDASHQMGTTRMSETPEYGVVDRNLRYFGLENLFIVGSSVFPKSGNANPTFTILALAMRLARYLHQLL